MTGVARSIPGLLWHAAVFELTMYVNLLRWIFRRPSIGSGDEPVGYAQQVTPVMSLWIFAAAAEMPIVHVLLPWRTAQLISIVLGLWTLVWMFGALAGLRTHPHLLSESGLRVRNGALIDIRLPWTAIASVTTKEVALPTTLKSQQPLATDSGTDLRVGVSGRVNIQAQLRAPLVVRTRKGGVLRQPGQLLGRRPPPGGRRDPTPGAPSRRRLNMLPRHHVAARPNVAVPRARALSEVGGRMGA